MRHIDYLIIHCTATPPSMDIGAAEIRDWHVNGNKWRDIGYHWVIRRDGTIEPGRNPDIAGAHTAGHNSNSLGVALVGGVSEADRKTPENNFTPEQWEALKGGLKTGLASYEGAVVAGHNEFSAKACPSFDARAWAKSHGFPTLDDYPGKAP